MRVGLVGAGAMGRNHARVYREIKDAELVGVADSDQVLAAEVALVNGTTAYSDHRDLLKRGRPEAVSVAVPTNQHHEVVLDLLEAGCHVLVEKPIAATVAQADDMVAAARRAGSVLMVGHVERFNPAVIEMKRQIDSGQLGRVFQANARRLGPFPARVRDVGVVIDLATHDVDVMRYLSGSEPTRVYAETKREVHTSNEDMLSGLIRFQNDMLGVLEINWLTPTKIRELWVTGERGMFRADYLTQDLYFYENAESPAGGWDALSVLRGVSEGMMVRFPIPKREPLRAELEVFLAAAGGRQAGVVTGEDGVAALRLALALIESGQEHQMVLM